MPNPHQVKPNDGNGCLVHAGILTPHGGDVSKAQLTSGFPEAAKERFIKEVVDRLTFKIPVPFPCGVDIDPLPADQSALLQNLADEQTYPDFHANVLNHYRDVARSLDSQSEFNLLPICDPIALGFKLGVNIKIPDLSDFMNFAIPNIPALAAKLDLSPPELALKIPGLIQPPSIPNFDFALPDPRLVLDLYEFRGFTITGEIPPLPPQLRFAKFLLDLTAKMPDFVINLITLDLKGFLGDICKLARGDKDSPGLFAKQSTDDKGVPQDVVRIVATEVLARKVMEMMIMCAMAKTVGTSPGGLTGQFGRYQTYSPPQMDEPPDDETPEERVRRIIVDTLEQGIGLCWSGDSKEGSMPYTEYIFPRECSTSEQYRLAAYKSAERASSCGLVARTALARAGATFVFDLEQSFDQAVIFGSNVPRIYTTPDGKKLTLDYFNDVYKGGAVSALVAIAYRKGACIAPSTVTKKNEYWTQKIYDLPALKRGDIIIIGSPNKNNDHVMVVFEDYNPGDEKLVCVHGGQLDQKNKGPASYIQPPEIIVVAGDENAEKGISSSISQSSASTQAEPDKEETSSANSSSSKSDQNYSGGESEESNASKTKEDTKKPKEVVKPKIGIRCTGIQKVEIWTEKSFKEKGLKLKPGGNLMGETGIGVMKKVNAGVAGNGVVALGDRTVKLLIDSAILVLGKKTNDVDTTKVGKDFLGSKERTLPPSKYAPGVDNNNEATANDKEISVEETEAAAADPAAKKAREDEEKKKKKDLEDKKKAAEKKKQDQLQAWSKK